SCSSSTSSLKLQTGAYVWSKDYGIVTCSNGPAIGFLRATPEYNKWTHVAYTYQTEPDGFGGQLPRHRFYLNGVSAWGNNGAIAFPELNTLLNCVKLGGHCGADGAFLEGCLSEVRIWNRVLTPAEISADRIGAPVADGLVSR